MKSIIKLVKRSSGILFLFFSFFSFSQNIKIKELKGQLVNDSLDVSGVHVVNKSSGATTISDRKGTFSVLTKLNDTLVFSAVQIQIRAIVIDTTFFDQDFLWIAVDPVVNKLKEVVVKPHSLSGNLSYDLAQIPKKQINFEDVGVPGFKGERKEKIVKPHNIALGVLAGGLDLEAIYKHISGYYVNLKKKRNLDVRFAVIYEMMDFYGTVFLLREFQLEEDELYAFLIGCSENSDIVAQFRASHHNLVIEYLHQCNEIV